MGLVNVDSGPHNEAEGLFLLGKSAGLLLTLDLTVVVSIDESGTERVYFSQYNLESREELPNIPTVAPRLLSQHKLTRA